MFPIFFSSSSSKFSSTNVVTVVMIPGYQHCYLQFGQAHLNCLPMKRLTQERVTKAELGMAKMKENGYMRGTEAQPYSSISSTSGPRLGSEM